MELLFESHNMISVALFSQKILNTLETCNVFVCRIKIGNALFVSYGKSLVDGDNGSNTGHCIVAGEARKIFLTQGAGVGQF